MLVFGEMQSAAFPARRERFQGELPVSPALEYDGFFKNFQSWFDIPFLRIQILYLRERATISNVARPSHVEMTYLFFISAR